MPAVHFPRRPACLLSLALGACAAAPTAIVEIGPQTFEASEKAARSKDTTALWHGLAAQAQAHCDQRQATAVGLQERRDEAQDRLALVFRCQ